jgi:hypothetical protein
MQEEEKANVVLLLSIYCAQQQYWMRWKNSASCEIANSSTTSTWAVVQVGREPKGVGGIPAW